VSFNYEEHQVLKRVSFLIKRNKTVAFVGPSGSGKTTILSLLLKLYRPTEGEIFINDISIDRIQTTSLRKAIAPVFQIPLLFNESIAKNISLTDGTDIDPIRIENALQLAHCAEFVDKLPHGIDTEIGDMGDRLSVGQKQRIILARAFYRDPDVILLDEPTSALDAHSEQLIIQSIRQLAGRKTIILVAHRLTTVQEADDILVLKEGQIIEQGSHQGLFKARGNYWSLYQHSVHEDTPASRT
jgi:ATP-binding cassette subfamily B protein